MMPINRAFLAAGVALLAFTGAAGAQEVPSATLPPITVLAPPAPHRSTEEGASSGTLSPDVCARAESGSQQALDCLNQQLKQQVDQINPGLTTPSAPLDARSSTPKIGIVNIPGVQQHYGQNFGVVRMDAAETPNDEVRVNCLVCGKYFQAVTCSWMKLSS